jgi:glycosyltransferase involved in cell wall biosynthesis
MSSVPKVALISPTVGQTRRGYERFMTDIQRVLKQEAQITLFKGAGPPGAAQKVVPHLRRTGVLSRLFPNRLLYHRYLLEFTTFGAALTPHLAWADYDVVHFIDPLLAKPLHLIRLGGRRRFGLLFTNGGPRLTECSPWIDHVHVVTPGGLAETRAAGVAEGRITMLPVGVDPANFTTALSRQEIRRQLKIPEDAFVVLSVTSMNRSHKRVDYLIREVGALTGNFLLWVDGSLHPDGDPTLLEMGDSILKGRWRHSQMRSDQIGCLFRAADILVSSAIQESFGLAIVEAACAGLPVITHDSPHFRWLLGGAGHFVNMGLAGELTAALTRLMNDSEELRRVVDPPSVLGRFGWEQLKRDYAALYARVAASRPNETAVVPI